MAMSTMIKSLEDIMRKDAGLNGDAQYIEQITWLLFLKAFDAKEMEWEFRPDCFPNILPYDLLFNLACRFVLPILSFALFGIEV